MQSISTDAIALKSFQSIKNHWKEFIVLPVAMGLLWVIASFFLITFTPASFKGMGILAAFLLFIGEIVFGLTYAGAQSIWCEEIFKGATQLNVEEGLQKGLRRVPGTLWTQIFLLIKIILWSCLFLIPGIYKAYQYILAQKVAHIEGIYGSAAHHRSRELVMSQGWLQTFGSMSAIGTVTVLGLYILVAVAGLALGAIGGILGVHGGVSAMVLGGLMLILGVGVLIALMVFMSNCIAFMFLTYREATKKKS